MFNNTNGGFRGLLLAIVILGFVMSVAAFLQGDTLFAWLGGMLLATGLGIWAMDG